MGKVGVEVDFHLDSLGCSSDRGHHAPVTAVGRPVFGVSTTKGPKLNLLRLEEDLSAAHLRLSGVTIEHLPYHQAIQRFDRLETFFYIDPPYYGCEGYYGEGVFSREDFSRLADLLAGIKGKFLLSLNDVPEVREIFQDFQIDPVTVRYTVSGPGTKEAPELLIRNYDL